MSSNEFYPFGTSGGANVETPANWLTDASRLTGFVSGEASSTKYNTTLRQSSEIAAMVGQFIANYSGNPALDDGNITELLANFVAAIKTTVPVYWGIDSGIANAYVVNPSPGITTLVAGTILVFQAHTTNTTTSTMNASSTGAISILSTSRVTLIGGAIANLGIYILVYDGTYWQLVSGTGIQTAPLGTTLDLPAGSAAINANDVVEISGITNAAYSATTIDYAVSPNTIVPTPFEFGMTPLNGAMRIAVERDALGNVFVLNAQSGNLWVNKFSSTGSLVSSAQLDTVSSTIYQAKLLKLSNGNFCVIYARAAGAMYFVIFDSQLSIIVAATSIATEYTPANIVYHAACALTGDGFAIAYQSAAAGTLEFTTYTTAGALNVSPTGVQSWSGGTAQATIQIAQLPNSNIVIATRTSMTTGGNGGTSFVIVTTGGAPVAGPGYVDLTATLGFVELSVLPALPNSGAFCVAEGNGTSMVAGVYTQAGVQNGSDFVVACTNNTLSYRQFSLTNDGAQFWLTYTPSVSSGSGITVARIPSTGTNTSQNTFWSSTLITGSGFGPTSSCASDIVNGMLAVLVCSTGTGGQYYGAFGLPDPTLDIGSTYSAVGPVLLGGAAGTTGSYWPKVMSFGDWVAGFFYDVQNVADQLFAIERLQSPQIIGVALTSVNAGSQGSAVTVAVNPGSFPINTLIGSGGQPFNQGVGGAIGNAGILYREGIVLFGIPATPAAPTPGASLLTGIFGSGNFQIFTSSNSSWVIPAPKIRCRLVGGGGGAGGGGTGGTTSIVGLGSTFQATGGGPGNSGSVGVGTGGQFQASGGLGGAAGTGNSTDGTGGGGGGAGSLNGNGGVGGVGSSTSLYGGGGGGCPGKGAAGTTTPGGGGGFFSANGINGGANSAGVVTPPAFYLNASSIFPLSSNGAPGPGNYTFPFFNQTGAGGSGYGGTGAPGGGGGGTTAGPGSGAGNGGDGGGGGGTSNAGTSVGGNGGYGGGGGGGNNTATGYPGGKGGGFAIGIFNVSVGGILNITVGAAGTAYTYGGAGGPGVVVIEW